LEASAGRRLGDRLAADESGGVGEIVAKLYRAAAGNAKMKPSERTMSVPGLNQLWEQHTAHEFSTRDTEHTSYNYGGGRVCQPRSGDDQWSRKAELRSGEMPWVLPGVAPTNRHVEIPLVVIVKFRDGKLAHEHIYWDQASVLRQIGLISDPRLPVFGAETARKVAP
jgi:hypothetical protein